MKISKHRALPRKKRRYSLAELLAQATDSGHGDNLLRTNPDLRAWDEMVPVGREEFGSAESQLGD